MLSPLKLKNKKGLSEVVGYVLLIAMALALASLVFVWLTVWIKPAEVSKCPEGTMLSIENYNCSFSATNNILTLEIKNRGLFNVSGFMVLGTNETGENIRPVRTIGTSYGNDFHTALRPGESVTYQLNFVIPAKNLTIIELQPYQLSGTKKIFCESVVRIETPKCS